MRFHKVTLQTTSRALSAVSSFTLFMVRIDSPASLTLLITWRFICSLIFSLCACSRISKPFYFRQLEILCPIYNIKQNKPVPHFVVRFVPGSTLWILEIDRPPGITALSSASTVPLGKIHNLGKS